MRLSTLSLSTRMPRRGARRIPREKIKKNRFQAFRIAWVQWFYGGLWALVILLPLWGVVRGVLWIRNPVHFPIRTIEINGRLTHLSMPVVKARIDRELKGNFFTLNLDSISNDLRQMPWIKQVAVSRVWPDELKVRIVQRRAVAKWNGKKLLSGDGHVFAPRSTTWPRTSLPSLRGPINETAQVWRRYLQARTLFQKAGLPVSGVDESARHAWRIYLANGIEIVMGRHWSNTKISKMLKVYQRMLAAHRSAILRIDLRYPNGFSVFWKAQGKHVNDQQGENK